MFPISSTSSRNLERHSPCILVAIKSNVEDKRCGGIIPVAWFQGFITIAGWIVPVNFRREDLDDRAPNHRPLRLAEESIERVYRLRANNIYYIFFVPLLSHTYIHTGTHAILNHVYRNYNAIILCCFKEFTGVQSLHREVIRMKFTTELITIARSFYCG